MSAIRACVDPEGRLEVWITIKKLAGAGTTILLTTQYLGEAEQLADQIAILHDGRIIAGGTLDELKALLPSEKVEYIETTDAGGDIPVHRQHERRAGRSMKALRDAVMLFGPRSVNSV